MTVEGTTGSISGALQNNFVGPEYLEALGIGLVKGREFRAEDTHGAPVPEIVINQEFARRYLSDRDPLGPHIRLPGPTEAGYPAEIVGVVRNSKHRSLGEDQQAAIYEAYAQRSNKQRVVHVFVRTTPASGATPRDVAQVLTELDVVRLGRRADDEEHPRVCVPAEPGRRGAPRHARRARPGAGDDRPLRRRLVLRRAVERRRSASEWRSARREPRSCA